MMKKSLAALAVLGAFAGSSMAADVTMYGVVDTGLVYSHDKAEASLFGFSASEKTDSFGMASGTNSASRFGVRGTEDLGNGLTVGFKLENGFESDTGALKTNGKLFDRESTLSLSGSFGTVYAGRMGTLVSDTGSVGFYGAMASAFGSGWSDNIAGHTAVMANYSSRYNNTLAYVSPEFAGVKVYAQYAMGDTNENKPSNDRYAALGAEWKAGALDLGVLVDWTNKDSSLDSVEIDGDRIEVKDAWTFNFGGSYDCGFAKTFLAVQYFKDARDAGSVATTIMDRVGSVLADNGVTEDELKALGSVVNASLAQTGYGVHVGTSFNALGGDWVAGIGYMDADVDFNAESKVAETNVYTAALGYQYNLSKRTKLYTGAGYVKREADILDALHLEQQGYDFVAGLVHKF